MLGFRCRWPKAVAAAVRTFASESSTAVAAKSETAFQKTCRNAESRERMLGEDARRYRNWKPSKHPVQTPRREPESIPQPEGQDLPRPEGQHENNDLGRDCVGLVLAKTKTYGLWYWVVMAIILQIVIALPAGIAQAVGVIDGISGTPMWERSFVPLIGTPFNCGGLNG